MIGGVIRIQLIKLFGTSLWRRVFLKFSQILVQFRFSAVFSESNTKYKLHQNQARPNLGDISMVHITY
jgi:hypothetical protein